MKIIFLIMMFGMNTIVEAKTLDFLLAPSGQYTVGYQDIFLINHTICPDRFYQKGINEADFTPDNPQYCHEMNIRVYYPSSGKPKSGDNYYPPFIRSNIEFYAKKFNLCKSTVDAMSALYDVKTYAVKDAPVLPGHPFPMIVFTSGYGVPIQAYNNIISELVSHGYVVVGYNSVFVNGAVQLSTGHVVKQPDKYQDFGRLENLEDLKFVLAQLPYLKYSKSLSNQVNLRKIGLLGHSMGAMSIVNLFKLGEISPSIKAILLMDPGNVLEQANYPIKLSALPSMVIWSSKFKQLLHGSVNLAKNSFEVVLAPSQKQFDYSNHENFFDMSTLQYHPSYQIKPIHDSLVDTQYLGVGLGNGYVIARDINRHLIDFFNVYLKDYPISKSF